MYLPYLICSHTLEESQNLENLKDQRQRIINANVLVAMFVECNNLAETAPHTKRFPSRITQSWSQKPELKLTRNLVFGNMNQVLTIMGTAVMQGWLCHRLRSFARETKNDGRSHGDEGKIQRTCCSLERTATYLLKLVPPWLQSWWVVSVNRRAALIQGEVLFLVRLSSPCSPHSRDALGNVKPSWSLHIRATQITMSRTSIKRCSLAACIT